MAEDTPNVDSGTPPGRDSLPPTEAAPDVELTTRARQPGAAPTDDEVDDDAEEAGTRRVINGRYVVLGTLGEGGMGVVYKALDRRRKANRMPVVHVALKFVNEAIRTNKTAIAALRAEINRTLALANENIVRTYDFDFDEGSGTPFLTMELLVGESLESVIKRYPEGVPLNECRDLIAQMTKGLEYLHKNGVVHSDLKPSNIFVTQARDVKILDFGIAAPLRRIGDPVSGSTMFDARGTKALTRAYASPEMFDGQAADARDDIYSLGLIVYQLLTGVHPFQTQAGPAAAPDARAAKMPVRPIPAVGRSRNRTLRRALAFERKHRLASASEFRQDFIGSGDGTAVSAMKWFPVASLAAALLAVLGVLAWNTWNMELSPASVPDVSRNPPEQGGEGPPSLPPEEPGRDPVEAACGSPASTTLLEGQIQQGLSAETDYSFAPSAQMREEAKTVLARTSACLKALHASGVSTPESVTWVETAEDILKKQP